MYETVGYGQARRAPRAVAVMESDCCPGLSPFDQTRRRTTARSRILPLSPPTHGPLLPTRLPAPCFQASTLVPRAIATRFSGSRRPPSPAHESTSWSSDSSSSRVLALPSGRSWTSRASPSGRRPPVLPLTISRHYMRSTMRASYDYRNTTGIEGNLQNRTKSTSSFQGFL